MEPDMNNYNNHSMSDTQEKQFHRSESVPHVTRRLIEMLDHIEQRVELLREAVAGLENEKEALISTLSSVKDNKDLSLAGEGEKEEIELTTQRLMKRILTVEVSVTIPRNEIQQKALDNVNKFFKELEENMKSDTLPLKDTLLVISSCLNACLSDCKGPVHQKFQSAVLECTADDQKQTRRKLESMINSLSPQ